VANIELLTAGILMVIPITLVPKKTVRDSVEGLFYLQNLDPPYSMASANLAGQMFAIHFLHLYLADFLSIP
jgi:hypothetical protein